MCAERRHPAGPRRQGFTLLEALLAIVVIGVGLTGVLACSIDREKLAAKAQAQRDERGFGVRRSRRDSDLLTKTNAKTLDRSARPKQPVGFRLRLTDDRWAWRNHHERAGLGETRHNAVRVDRCVVAIGAFWFDRRSQPGSNAQDIAGKQGLGRRALQPEHAAPRLVEAATTSVAAMDCEDRDGNTQSRAGGRRGQAHLCRNPLRFVSWIAGQQRSDL